MIKFGFRIKTHGGMFVDNLNIAARDRAEAERKLTQIYHNCEILECTELQTATREDGLSLESALTLITREAESEPPPKG